MSCSSNPPVVSVISRPLALVVHWEIYSGLRVGEKPDSAGTQTPRHRRRHGAHGRTDELVNKRIGNAGLLARVHPCARRNM